MGAGYTRQAQNNIVDGAVIDSDDLNAEFNQVEAAFNSTTGHTHDGTEGEGPQIDTAGLADDAVTPAKVDSTGTFEVAGLVVGGTTLNSANLEVLDGATITTAELNILDGVTATANEINTLDGITSSTSELNILDGATVTASELNILDGATVNASELNILDGAIISTTELNYLDGASGNIQTQINALSGSGDGFVAEVTASAPLSATAGSTPDISLSGTVPVANGGTGRTTLGSGEYLLGNGTGGVTSTASVPATDISGTLAIANGGTGQTGVPADGQLLIGNGSGFSRANITAGTGIDITNGFGSITISTDGSSSGVQSVTASSPLSATTGDNPNISLDTVPVSKGGTGTTVLTSGRYLKGNGTSAIATQIGVPATDITGTLSVSSGGTGKTSLDNGEYLVGNGTSSISTVSSIPSSDVSGLGSMATQNSSSVNITGGDATLDVIEANEVYINSNNSFNDGLIVGASSSPSAFWNAYVKGYAGAHPALFVEGGNNSNAIVTAMRTDYVNTYYLWLAYGDYSTNIGGITCTSTNSVAYNTASDYRLKANVTPMTGAVDRINSLNPVRFQWANELENPAVDGFLAHEVTPVVPEAITGEKDAVNEDGSIKAQAIDQSKLVPLLVGAVQELTARVEQLEAQLNSQ